MRAHGSEIGEAKKSYVRRRQVGDGLPLDQLRQIRRQQVGDGLLYQLRTPGRGDNPRRPRSPTPSRTAGPGRGGDRGSAGSSTAAASSGPSTRKEPGAPAAAGQEAPCASAGPGPPATRGRAASAPAPARPRPRRRLLGGRRASRACRSTGPTRGKARRNTAQGTHHMLGHGTPCVAELAGLARTPRERRQRPHRHPPRDRRRCG